MEPSSSAFSSLIQGPLYGVAAVFPCLAMTLALEVGNRAAGLVVNVTNIATRLLVAGVAGPFTQTARVNAHCSCGAARKQHDQASSWQAA